MKLIDACLQPLVRFLRGRNAAPVDRGQPEGASAPDAVSQVVVHPTTRPERRRTPRRYGDPVEVLLKIEGSADPPVSAWVVDRSSAGLGISIASAEAIPQGTVFYLRVAAVPTTWVRVEVIYSRPLPGGARWIAGCQYADPPTPSTVILLR